MESVDKKCILSITPLELSKKIKEKISGHSKEIDILSLEIINHFFKVSNKSHFNTIKKNNIFITGSSGVGKTYMIQSMAEYLDINFISIDITSYTSSGFHGNNVSEIIVKIKRAIGNSENNNCIVFIDEVDKLKFGGAENSSNKDFSGKGVQEELLKLIESVNIENDIDMSKILFICAGAFDEIESIVENDCKSIGFNSNTYFERNNLRKNIKRTHLIKYGLMPEFVGRFSTLLNLSNLNELELQCILTSKEGILKECKSMLSLYNIRLSISNDFYNTIIKYALIENLGARSLRNLIMPYMNYMLFKALSEKKPTIFFSSKTYLEFIDID